MTDSVQCPYCKDHYGPDDLAKGVYQDDFVTRIGETTCAGCADELEICGNCGHVEARKDMTALNDVWYCYGTCITDACVEDAIDRDHQHKERTT